MTQETQVPKTRLILEAVAAVVVFFVMILVVVTAAYLVMEGYSQESVAAMRTPEGVEKVKFYGFLMTPVAMLLTVFTVLFMLKLRGKGFGDIGLSKPDNIGKMVLLGLVTGIIVYVAAVVVQYILAQEGLIVDVDDYSIIQGNFALYLFAMTAISWVSAAFGEEVVFRGFILNNLAQAFGGSQTGFVFAIFVQAILFAGLHANQGLAGVAAVFLMALVFGFAYLKFRSLWPLIIGHALVDNYSFTLLYLAGSA